MKHAKESTPVPSVERFDDADFAELLRSRTDSNAECAICLADLSPDEAQGWSLTIQCSCV